METLFLKFPQDVILQLDDFCSGRRRICAVQVRDPHSGAVPRLVERSEQERLNRLQVKRSKFLSKMRTLLQSFSN
jgi:hypothetical protein